MARNLCGSAGPAIDKTTHFSAAAPERLPRLDARVSRVGSSAIGSIERTTSFIGRRSELARARSLLRHGRLVTVVGPPGSGKTRLAVELASRSALHDPPAALAPLAEVSDGARLGSAVAQSFGLTTDRDPLEAVIAWLADREALLVLDNCEHLIAASAGVASRLLEGCGRLKIVATSREALSLAAELVLPLGGLSLPVGQAWRRSEAVRLFSERARGADPNFAVHERNFDDVLAICRRLEGNPLALELAARRVHGRSVRDIRAGLDDALDLLRPPSRHAPSKHGTIRGAIDWSHRLLSELERRVFRRLGLFAGGSSSELAVHVCVDEQTPTSSVVQALARLVDQSLVRRTETSSGTRLSLLEVIRQYAHEQLANAGEVEAIERRRAAWIASLFDEFDPARQARPMQTLSRIVMEQDNVRAAVPWLLAHDLSTARRVLAKAWQVYVFLRPGLDPAEIEGWLVRALDADPAPDGLRARMLVALAQRRFARGDRSGSASAAEEALSIAEASGDDNAGAGAHHRLALASLAVGDAERGVAHFTSAIERYERSNRPGAAWALAQRSQARALGGDAPGARADLARALAVCESLPGHERLRAIVRVLEGRQTVREGRLDAAQSAFSDTLRVWQRVGSEIPIAQALHGVAEIAARRGQRDRALRLLAAAKELRSRTGDTWPATDHPGDRLSSLEREGAGRPSRGPRMSIDAAVAYALRERRARADPLTPREHEVVALIAEGMTSRDIAARFGVATRTVENHVQHVLTKLGLRSRAQIVRWALTSSSQPHGVQTHE